jgi:carbamoyltransferase
VICGVKPGHDGGIAVIDGNRLLFSIEAEKLDNSPRYSRLAGIGMIIDQLRANGVDPRQVEHLVIDGWNPTGPWATKEITTAEGRTVPLSLAGYTDRADERFRSGNFAEVGGTLPFEDRELKYRSYPHTIGHAFSAYCTSPFAPADQDALILVWDGGTDALLYLFEAGGRGLVNLGTVLDTSGVIYPVFASSLSPYRAYWLRGVARGGPDEAAADEETTFGWLLSVPGKAMAYAGLGSIDEAAVMALDELSGDGVGRPGPVVWTTKCRRRLRELGLSDASQMASVQEFLYRRLEQGIKAKLGEAALARELPLCFAGGCALNIKWNSRLRSSGLFSDVWVPPFPNDAGSAIGTACAEMVRTSGHRALAWSVFSGPLPGPPHPSPAGWATRRCTPEDLADLLHEDGRPVVVIDGRAELGPRALGHRSILAPATDPGMQDHLNKIKDREDYRPVAPICLESRAAELFDPGVRDPYMLFDHAVRPEWVSRIPAIVHADGTARLQTVGPDNELAFKILTRYQARSGIPVLCNTSANLNGRGFFPDVASALRWNCTDYVWADNGLYSRTQV